MVRKISKHSKTPISHFSYIGLIVLHVSTQAQSRHKAKSSHKELLCKITYLLYKVCVPVEI